MQHFEDGGKVMVNSNYGAQVVQKFHGLTWNWEENDYEIVRGPLECWINISPGPTKGAIVLGYGYSTKYSADKVAPKDRIRVAKFREIT